MKQASPWRNAKIVQPGYSSRSRASAPVSSMLPSACSASSRASTTFSTPPASMARVSAITASLHSSNGTETPSSANAVRATDSWSSAPSPSSDARWKRTASGDWPACTITFSVTRAPPPSRRYSNSGTTSVPSPNADQCSARRASAANANPAIATRSSCRFATATPDSVRHAAAASAKRPSPRTSNVRAEPAATVTLSRDGCSQYDVRCPARTARRYRRSASTGVVGWL